MKLVDFLKVLSCYVSFTVGTENGNGWVVYYDGEHGVQLPFDLLYRPISHIYSRDYREPETTCCELKAGLAIIVEGNECGVY